MFNKPNLLMKYFDKWLSIYQRWLCFFWTAEFSREIKRIYIYCLSQLFFYLSPQALASSSSILKIRWFLYWYKRPLCLKINEWWRYLLIKKSFRDSLMDLLLYICTKLYQVLTMKCIVTKLGELFFIYFKSGFIV